MAVYLVTIGSILAASCLGFVLLAQPLVNQAREFLREKSGPGLVRWQIWAVSAVFSSTCTALIATTLFSDLTHWDTFRYLVLFGWAVPMTLLDLRNNWLPKEFTFPFWLCGVLFTWLPDAVQTSRNAILASALMFAALRFVHYLSLKIQGKEGIGLGDVYLISALCAWYPLQTATLITGIALVLFTLCALLTRQYTQPFAPWLFGLLALLAVGAFSL
ncbi:TPA: prepilin peptidase [Serratia marcescens]